MNFIIISVTCFVARLLLSFSMSNTNIKIAVLKTVKLKAPVSEVRKKEIAPRKFIARLITYILIGIGRRSITYKEPSRNIRKMYFNS